MGGRWARQYEKSIMVNGKVDNGPRRQLLHWWWVFGAPTRILTCCTEPELVEWGIFDAHSEYDAEDRRLLPCSANSEFTRLCVFALLLPPSEAIPLLQLHWWYRESGCRRNSLSDRRRGVKLREHGYNQISEIFFSIRQMCSVGTPWRPEARSDAYNVVWVQEDKEYHDNA